MKGLQGKVAVVTGASRGAGRGIAHVLGEAGATVYVTGRSTRAQLVNQLWPETIEETAEGVTARGGLGIPVRCDHTRDEDVAALFAQVRAEQGRLEILVNNAWGGYQYDYESFSVPFWEQPDRWNAMFTAGVRAHLNASRLAVPLLCKEPGGLIVNTTVYDRGKYLSNLYYDLAKTAVNRMAYGMALELKPHGITAVALAPGWMRTERVMDTNPSAEELTTTESPEYIGRAVLALALDPERLARSGRTLNVGDLAESYGFTDVDGRQVPTFRIPDEHLRD
ncbi:MAG TPA: SDR family NAD(P)-dependent oxidoreductase [Symbiobacteriaceae bacterium]|nr:SDR family NAD(P)-dependent oxidoreductase [Symbiobacteriaceae bacterium]